MSSSSKLACGDGGSSKSSGQPGSDKAALLKTIQPELFTENDKPKQGKGGEQISCRANFVPIERLLSDENISQYHVSFSPEVDSKKSRSEILLQSSVTDVIGQFFIFDGQILYLLSGHPIEERIEARHPITNEVIGIQMKKSVTFARDDPQVINCYNIIIRRCFDRLKMMQLQRNYYNPAHGLKILQYGLEVWPGFETAVRLYDGGLMLCIENRFKVLHTTTMYKLMLKEFEACQRNADRMQTKVEEEWIGQSVVTYYNNKVHRITSIAWNMTPNATFEMASGESISLGEYVLKQHGIKIENPDQPIIVSEGKPKQPGEPPQRHYLIPELCRPTGLTDDMRKDNRVMRALAEKTRLSPDVRRTGIRSLLTDIHASSECTELLRAWGISLGDDCVDLNARLLPSEKIYGKKPQPFVGRKAEWSKEAKSNGSYRNQDMRTWVLVLPRHEENDYLSKRFIDEVRSVGNNLKMAIGSPIIQAVDGKAFPDYQRAITNGLAKAGAQSVDMVVVLLDDDNKTRYDSLKAFLCSDEIAVPSQCVVLSTLRGRPGDGGHNKNFGSIVLKIVLQMNCKMGGALWKVDIPLKDSMIVGYDLYHDSTLRGKTIGACVSTYSSDFTQYYSQTRPHDNPTELGNNLVHFVKKALRKYYVENSNTLPNRLFLYRDGAGDGQIPFIKTQEVALVKEACESIAKRCGMADHTIKISFTIVTKKVNMRVFASSANGGVVNPSPGTVVDGAVTRPERFDFYLVPQFVTQGTVTPVCYNVIYDDTDLTADKHQRLAFKLCHLYYNWQGTVRVPAPCQYAHKLAFLVAQSIHKPAPESLRDKLFFL